MKSAFTNSKPIVKINATFDNAKKKCNIKKNSRGGYQKQILWVRLVSDSKIEEKGTVLERQFSHFL
jgi:hypothetical protein